jgi:hypothetical protein
MPHSTLGTLGRDEGERVTSAPIPKEKERVVVRATATIHLWGGPAGNVVRMAGVMREADAESWLVPLLSDVHRTAIVRRFKEVELDIRDLEYANAALWRSLVVWIKRIREQSGSYNLRVTWDRSRRWQEIALSTLRVFAFDPKTGVGVVLEGVDP